jgi:hypothetical protein
MNKFEALCNSISNKSIFELSSSDVNHFLMHAKILNKQIETLDIATSKVRIRETMALNHAILPRSKERHKENLHLLNLIPNLPKQRSIKDLWNDFNNYTSSLSTNKLSKDNINKFIAFAEEIDSRHKETTQSNKRSIKLHEIVKSLDESMLSSILELEKKALGVAKFDSEIKKHRHNIAILKKVRNEIKVLKLE